MASVIAAAGVDPYALHESLASGDPAAIITLQVVRSGGAAVQAHIDDYDGVLGHGTGMLGELGYAATPGPDDPGVPGGAKYAIGPPTRPPFTFDDDFVFDPAADASLGDHVSWNEWGSTMSAAGLLRPDLDDALLLYAHYRDGSGAPATVDYEEGYREDPSIRQGDAADAGPYPETEDWQKALGAHQVWSSGDVTIDGNRATMTVTVHAEDRYNFNRGANDIASGAPDDENGRFAELGLGEVLRRQRRRHPHRELGCRQRCATGGHRGRHDAGPRW